MAIKITLDPVRGLVEENVAAGSSDALPQGLSPYRLPVTVIHAANATLGADAGGVYVLSASTGGAKTLFLPPVATAAGMHLIVRAGSDDAHVVSASNGGRPIAGLLLNLTASSGQRVTLPALAGAAINLTSDGANWHLLVASGSVTVAGV